MIGIGSRALLASVLLALVPQGISAQAQDLVVELANDTERERATRERLLALVDSFDVERWTYTRKVRIDEDAIPHSHPVLTLHTRSLGRDLDLLSTYLHEQFHWVVDARPEDEAAAIAELRRLFPEVPTGRPLGARDEHSSYLHLIVCDLEVQAMEALVGREKAVELARSTRHYTWIYEQVVENPEVRRVTTTHGFVAVPGSEADGSP